MLRFLLLGLGLMALVPGGCAGGYTGDAKVRWEADQALMDQAQRARTAGDFETAARVYEQLWEEAARPNPQPGEQGSYFVVYAMSHMSREWESGRERFTSLERPIGELVEQGRATPTQCGAWDNLVSFFDMNDRIIHVAEKLRDDPAARRAFDAPPYFRKRLMRRVCENGRKDLESVYAPSAGAAIVDSAGNAVGAVLSIPLIPILDR